MTRPHAPGPVALDEHARARTVATLIEPAAAGLGVCRAAALARDAGAVEAAAGPRAPPTAALARAHGAVGRLPAVGCHPLVRPCRASAIVPHACRPQPPTKTKSTSRF